jgi:hypothetical protein
MFGEGRQAVGSVEPDLKTTGDQSPLPGNRGRVEGGAERYYVRDHQNRVSGPFSAADLKGRAVDKQFDLSWEVSVDKVNWCAAAKVEGLFAGLEAALADNFSTGKQYRDLTHREAVALFLDKFILNNENFKDSFPFLQTIRVWWAKLTLPKDFIITEVTEEGVHHVKYNVGTGETREIDPQEKERNVSQGIKQFNWFLIVAFVLGVVWLGWTARDFVNDFSLIWGTLKTVFLTVVALVGFIYKTKRSKVFIGYALDPAASGRMAEIADALRALRRCSQVWRYQVQQSDGRLNWKYNAGDAFKVARLPLAIFNRTIPNVETNVRVHGITFGSQAVYFLPEKILVIDGGTVKNVPYAELQIEVDHLEYVESEGHVYQDSQVIAHRWKFINRDGSQDRRFKDNVELPVVRCGILAIAVGGSWFKMMTTSPRAPSVAREKLYRLPVPRR